jgi:MoaA/NifB/PqqE/SkfB family radical SAM enzyme
LIGTFRVGLLITERCNIECAHCWLGSGPDRGATMGMGDARWFIAQAGEIPTVEWISLTGGEPFLYPELLEASVRYASEKGLRTECVTNCHWAGTEQEAEEALGKIVEAGLDVINMSVDDFHQRHIHFEKVGNCYRAAKSLGLKVVVMCAAARSSALRANEVKILMGDGDIQILRAGEPRPKAQAIIIEDPFIPVGRGAEIPEEEWLIGENPVGGPCKLALRDIGMSPSGGVLPCCSAASLVEKAHLGNAREESLTEILERAARRPLFKALKKDGPSVLAEKLNLQKSGYVSRCHLCHDVLVNPGLDRILTEY